MEGSDKTVTGCSAHTCSEDTKDLRDEGIPEYDEATLAKRL
jgi:hypothetical protein